MIGWIAACLTGAILPCFIWLLGDVFDSFNPENDPDETRDRLRNVFYAMLGLCGGITITATVQFSTLAAAGAKITARIKKQYLAAILRQESAWFDIINYTALSSRLVKETATIQRAIGDKFGQIIFSLSMSLSGLALGLTKGWSLGLAMIGIGPILIIGMAVFQNAL